MAFGTNGVEAPFCIVLFYFVALHFVLSTEVKLLEINYLTINVCSLHKVIVWLNALNVVN